jgi:hypothetical protein
MKAEKANKYLGERFYSAISFMEENGCTSGIVGDYAEKENISKKQMPFWLYTYFAEWIVSLVDNKEITKVAGFNKLVKFAELINDEINC